MIHPFVKFSDVVHLTTFRLADPTTAGIERFVGLEHIEPENLHIHSWGLVSDGITFTKPFKPRTGAFRQAPGISAEGGNCRL